MVRPKFRAQTLKGLSLRIALISAAAAGLTACGDDSNGFSPVVVAPGVEAPEQLAITTSALPSASVGQAYQANVTAAGGSTPYAWTIAGSLPAGLTLTEGTPSATISGTPTVSGTFTVEITVTDSRGDATTRQLPLTIGSAPVAQPLAVTSPSPLPPGFASAPYAITLTASGGQGAYTWSLISGTLPTGLILTPSGTITGTPTNVGLSNFVIQVQDGAGTTATQLTSLEIQTPVLGGPGPGASLQIATAGLPTVFEGLAFSTFVIGGGGSGSGLSWSVTSGALPPGLTLTSVGTPAATLSGTVPAAEIGNTFTFTVTVVDSLGATASQAYSVTIRNRPLAFVTQFLNPATDGSNFNGQITGTGGTGLGYTWQVTGLPPGLSANTTGTPSVDITGTPTTFGSFTLAVVLTDDGGNTINSQIPFAVNQGNLNVTTSTLPFGVENTVYAGATLQAELGSRAGYTWAVNPSLPAGMSLDTNTGVISGTPATPTQSAPTFTFTVTDGDGNTDSQDLDLIIDPTLVVATTSLADGEDGISYSEVLGATGGSGTGYTWSFVSGTLPGTLAVASDGTVSGVPTFTTAPPWSKTTFTFTVQITDSRGQTATGPVDVAVDLAPLVFKSMTVFPKPVLNQSFGGYTFNASGGTGSYTFTALTTSETLHTGLSISGDTLSGTPTAAGVKLVDIQLADSAGTTRTRQFRVTVLWQDRYAGVVGDMNVSARQEIEVIDFTTGTPTIFNPLVSGDTVWPSVCDIDIFSVSDSDLNEVRMSADGRYLGIMCDYVASSQYDLLMIDLTVSPAVMVNLTKVGSLADVNYWGFSPDGKKVAVNYDPSGSSLDEWYVLDMSNGIPANPSTSFRRAHVAITSTILKPEFVSSTFSEQEFSWSWDSKYFFFTGDLIVSSRVDAYFYEVGTTVTNQANQLLFNTASAADVEMIKGANDGVVLIAVDQDIGGFVEMFALDMDSGSAPYTLTQLSPTGWSSTFSDVADGGFPNADDIILSADGRMVAFTGDGTRSGQMELWVSDLRAGLGSGATAVKVTPDTTQTSSAIDVQAFSFFDMFSPEWSPQDYRLIFRWDDPVSVEQLFVVELAGGTSSVTPRRLHQASTSTSFDVLQADWSPDGNYVTWRGALGNTVAFDDSIFMVDMRNEITADLSSVTRVIGETSSSLLEGINWVWAPDSTFLVAIGDFLVDGQTIAVKIDMPVGGGIPAFVTSPVSAIGSVSTNLGVSPLTTRAGVLQIDQSGRYFMWYGDGDTDFKEEIFRTDLTNSTGNRTVLHSRNGTSSALEAFRLYYPNGEPKQLRNPGQY